MTESITYRIRHASASDLAACLELRVRAEEALAKAGVEQWHDRELGREVITRWIDQGAMHVVTTLAGDVVACFALAGADTAFWTPAEAVQPALYLYKFIVRADRRGAGLGDALLQWCAQRAVDVGARWLRLDCWRTNIKLHDYWRSRGFRLVDVRDHPTRNSGALFELDARARAAAAELGGAVQLVDDTTPRLTADARMRTTGDRYDPTGEAVVWGEAADVVTALKRAWSPDDERALGALEQAARKLENRARAVRQAAGMYYRVIST